VCRPSFEPGINESKVLPHYKENIRPPNPHTPQATELEYMWCQQHRQDSP
jgi:hypothetical protein